MFDYLYVCLILFRILLVFVMPCRGVVSINTYVLVAVSCSVAVLCVAVASWSCKFYARLGVVFSWFYDWGRSDDCGTLR